MSSNTSRDQVPSSPNSFKHRLDDLGSAYESDMADNKRRHKETNDNIVKLNDQLPVMMATILRKFDNIEKQFDNMGKRFDNIDKRLDNMDNRLDNMEARQDRMEAGQNELKTKMDFLFNAEKTRNRVLAARVRNNKMEKITDPLTPVPYPDGDLPTPQIRNVRQIVNMKKPDLQKYLANYEVRAPAGSSVDDMKKDLCAIVNGPSLPKQD